MATKNIAVKKKKKVWLSIQAPEFMGHAVLGESNVYEKEELVGKTLCLNLATITNDMKKQNINVTFKVVGIHEGKGQTQLVDYVLVSSYIKRLIRRKREKIEDSFLARTKDGKVVRVKPIAITNSDTYNSIITKIRLGMKAMIKNSLKEKTFEEFVSDLTNLKLQKEMKEKLNKIYPLKYVDIRQILLEEKGKIKDEEINEELIFRAKEEDLDEEDEEKETKTDSESEETEEEELDEEENK
jgi:small subunit ribosomal protein S3Ae